MSSRSRFGWRSPLRCATGTLRRIFVLALSVASLMAGCSIVDALWPAIWPAAAPTSTSTPTATLTATFTPTATCTYTPTPTPTPTAMPTVTATPTSIPTPTPDLLRLAVDVDPLVVKQGHTLLVQVHANRGITASGAFDGRTLFFVSGDDMAWTLAGMPVDASPGTHLIQLSVVDSLGSEVATTVSVVVADADFGSERLVIPPDRIDLLEPQTTQEEAMRLAVLFSTITPLRQWQGSFIWPHTGSITSPFGIARGYNNGSSSYHRGVDISGQEGAPVIAAASGRVALAALLRVRGNAVILDHGLGVYSGYYHLSQILVQEGQQVAQGETIGRLGNTGLSTGAHLHWEMSVGGVFVDPLEWTTRRIPD